jgi:CheY-like chemotaxis protein
MAKILVVEDDELLREIYSDTLIGEGYTIDTAADGEEAFTKMSQGGWDLVLLDIIIPKMSGIDVAQKIKATPPTIPNKSIVFLTNLDKGDEIKTALGLGQGYLIKSQITPGDLVREVKTYLEKGGTGTPTGTPPPPTAPSTT